MSKSTSCTNCGHENKAKPGEKLAACRRCGQRFETPLESPQEDQQSRLRETLLD
jgi:ribosomal protein L37AE/L43A